MGNGQESRSQDSLVSMTPKDSTRPPNATSYRQTAFGVLPRHELVKKESEGIAKGLDFILNLADNTKLNEELLLKLHKTCFGWIFPDWAGKYRKMNVQTSTHKFPPFPEVPELTRNFFADLNERLNHQPDSVALIAWAQHRLVWIHPFKDYNGRTARLFSNLLMLRLNLPLAEIKVESEKDRQTYITALKAADKGSYAPLEKLIKTAIEEAKADVE